MHLELMRPRVQVEFSGRGAAFTLAILGRSQGGATLKLHNEIFYIIEVFYIILYHLTTKVLTIL